MADYSFGEIPSVKNEWEAQVRDSDGKESIQQAGQIAELGTNLTYEAFSFYADALPFAFAIALLATIGKFAGYVLDHTKP